MAVGGVPIRTYISPCDMRHARSAKGRYVGTAPTNNHYSVTNGAVAGKET